MFVRTKISSNGSRKVQLVESYRENGKVRQRIVRHIGQALSDEEQRRLEDLAQYIKTTLENPQEPTLFNPDELSRISYETKFKSGKLPVDLIRLREEQRLIIGFHDIYGGLYKILGFNKILNKCRVSSNVMRDVILCRLAFPLSKRATVELLKVKFGITHSLDAVYRMMDHLDQQTISQIQQITYLQSMRLLDNKVSVLFYDCTTLYFESFIEDELKQYGYSKDHKFNQSQVLLALMVTKEGLPIGYEVFEGSCFEGKTLKIALDKIKKQYHLERVIFVADSALLSKDNLEMIEQEQIEYIVGARLASLSKRWKDTILDNKKYVKQTVNGDTLRLSDFFYNENRRLITNHSLKRAEKDRHDRQKAVERLQTRLSKSANAKELISNYGYKKFIKINGQAKVELNQEKIQDQAQWDGLHGVFTNIKDLSAKEILSHYHGLWQVEESFRINKHDLRMRPIFHWTPLRIKAHIAICYTAFALIRQMQYLLKKNNLRLSAEAIREELEQTQLSVLLHLDTKEQYIIPSKPGNKVKQIYDIMKLKLNVVPWKVNKASN